jgi:hypothetical protein
MSPGAELAASSLRHASAEFQYLPNSSLPVHLRGDMHAGSPTSTSSAGYNSSIRPTSHPTGYGPPPTLEPSLDQHQSGPGSTVGSPHMGSVGWQSPTHVASPSHSGGTPYVYPDPEAYPSNSGGMGQMFYGGPGQMRRQHSAEPPAGAYDVKGRQGELWAGAQ